MDRQLTDLSIPARPPRAGEIASHMVYANRLWHHVLEYGHGRDVIVLIPGMTASAAALAFLARDLADRHRVLVVDTRGRGLSDHPPAGFALSDYVADLAGVLDGLYVEQAVLVGHSLGARIAAAFDVAHPDSARGLVLVDPPLSGPGRAPYPYPLTMYREMFDIARDAPDPVAELAKVEPGSSDDVLAERVRWLRVTDENAVAATHRGFHEEDYVALHAAISAPAILVRGADSAVVTDSGAAELARLRPDIPVVAVPRAGHLVPQDNLDGFRSAVEEFLTHVIQRNARPSTSTTEASVT